MKSNDDNQGRINMADQGEVRLDDKKRIDRLEKEINDIEQKISSLEERVDMLEEFVNSPRSTGAPDITRFKPPRLERGPGEHDFL